jgi:hypothetical protein
MSGSSEYQQRVADVETAADQFGELLARLRYSGGWSWDEIRANFLWAIDEAERQELEDEP